MGRAWGFRSERQDSSPACARNGTPLPTHMHGSQPRAVQIQIASKSLSSSSGRETAGVTSQNEVLERWLRG